MKCAYFSRGSCRSCELMGQDYRDQVRDKMRTTRRMLYPFLTPDTKWNSPFQCPQPGFRNKAKMVISGSKKTITLGLAPTPRHPHGVDLEKCPLYPESIRATFAPIRQWLLRLGARPYQIDAHRGELRHVLVSANPAGELMVRLVLRSKAALKRVENTWPDLARELPGLRVFSVNIQPEHTTLIDGPEEIVLSPQRFLPMPGVGTDLFLAPGAFFQTNTAGALALYNQAAEWAARLRPGLVWDLYCGVGGFGFAVADSLGANPSPGEAGGGEPGSCQVIGVELAGAAIEGAKHAAQLQRATPGQAPHENQTTQVTGDTTGSNTTDNITTNQVISKPAANGLRFITADAGKWIKNQKKLVTPDLLVVNPPRRGLGNELSKWIEKSEIPHVIYSSCYQPSLVDNLHRMKSYRITELKLVDMFPHTRHVETIVLLSRK
ncbi:23S rRNA (uracil747-C5)-methyltransferase [Mobiluncus mulieris]|nr:23S rRNA methyltransferase [Mobiluncus mulieris]MBB5846293.1 23S rRNA (uracil747-C5)-methyltransferase [Mobiluncus mulieris]